MQALKLVDTSTLTYEEWLSFRRKGIGGSDIAAILGKSPYETPLSIWLQKLGKGPPKEENDYMYFGTVLEPIVAQEFARRSGLRVEEMSTMLQHPMYPFLLANVDRVVIDEERGYGILECKTASAFKQSEWENGKVPEAYYWQVQHYLGVTGYQFAYAACLIGGNTFRYSFIERNERDIDFLTEKATDFWYLHIESQIPPDVTSQDNLITLYPQSQPDADRVMSLEELPILDEWKAARMASQSAQDHEKLIENQIKEMMGVAEYLVWEDERLASWKSDKNGKRTFKCLMKED